MGEELKNSIKAKLYDFAYTPFMSSFVIAWVILNHKYLLIIFGDEKLTNKVKLLDGHVFHMLPWKGYCWWMDQFWYPLGIALIYVFIYPAFALGFYAITLWYKKWSKDVKTKIEKITPIHPEEARKIREDITRLSDEKDDTLIKLGKKEQEYKDTLFVTLQPLRDEITSLNDKSTKSAEEKQSQLREVESLNSQLGQANKMLDIKIEQCDELQKKVEELTNQLSAVGIVNATTAIVGSQMSMSDQQEDDKTKVLKFLYKTNYKTKPIDEAIDDIISETSLSRAEVSVIIKNLQADGLFENNAYSLTLADKGNNVLVKKFSQSTQIKELI